MNRNPLDEEIRLLSRTAPNDVVAAEKLRRLYAQTGDMPPQDQKFLVRGTLKGVFYQDLTLSGTWLDKVVLIAPRFWSTSYPAYQLAGRLRSSIGREIEMRVQWSGAWGWHVYPASPRSGTVVVLDKRPRSRGVDPGRRPNPSLDEEIRLLSRVAPDDVVAAEKLRRLYIRAGDKPPESQKFLVRGILKAVYYHDMTLSGTWLDKVALIAPPFWGAIYPTYQLTGSLRSSIDREIEMRVQWSSAWGWHIVPRFAQCDSEIPFSILPSAQRHPRRPRRRCSNPSRWNLEELKPSWIDDKKFVAVFRDDANNQKTVHFGAAGYEDFTTHGDLERKARYLERHGRGRDDWDDPTTPGALSRWILWNKPTLEASIADFKRRFSL